AIRPLDHERERHIARGHALAVAQERGHLYGLSGAVDPALGIDESVEPSRHHAAGDAAVGQIETWYLQTQEGVIAPAVARDQHGRPQRALAARQLGLDLHVAALLPTPPPNPPLRPHLHP